MQLKMIMGAVLCLLMTTGSVLAALPCGFGCKACVANSNEFCAECHEYYELNPTTKKCIDKVDDALKELQGGPLEVRHSLLFAYIFWLLLVTAYYFITKHCCRKHFPSEEDVNKEDIEELH